VFITGGSGLLGVNWAYFKHQEHQIALLLNSRGINLKKVETIPVNLDSDLNVKKFFSELGPSVVIHCAAITDVEFCQSHQAEAYNVNTKLAERMAKVCYANNHKFVYISSDHLFQGNRSFETEESIIDPLNIYGASKAKGEELVQRNNPESLIIRTNFFGWGTSYRRSFSDFLITSLREKKKVNLYSDIFHTPIYSKYLIEYVHMLIDSEQSGVFNVVGPDRISKHFFGVELFNVFSGDSQLINKMEYSSVSHNIPRPMDMSLSNKKVVKFLGINTPNFRRQLMTLKSDEASFKAFLGSI